jgi:phage terminase small subunit
LNYDQEIEVYTMKENLTPRQRKVLEALMISGDVTEAARNGGVSRETVYKWLKQPTFGEAIVTSTERALEDLERRMVAMVDQAISTFRSTLEDPNVSPALKVKTADLVLERLFQIHDLITLERRMKRLEDQYQISHEQEK